MWQIDPFADLGDSGDTVGEQQGYIRTSSFLLFLMIIFFSLAFVGFARPFPPLLRHHHLFSSTTTNNKRQSAPGGVIWKTQLS